MLTALVVMLRSLALICGGHHAIALENLALRQQLTVLQRRSSIHLTDTTAGHHATDPEDARPADHHRTTTRGSTARPYHVSHCSSGKCPEKRSG
jgi:hypothetical protein